MKHWPPRFSGLFWSGGFALLYTAHRAKDQYVKAGTDSMRVRFVQGGFLFLLCVPWWSVPALADERGPLWEVAERVCASGQTLTVANSEDLPLHGIGAANQPIRLIQDVERTGAGPRIRGILMPLAQCSENKPVAGGTMHLIFGMAELGEGHSYLTSPAGELISAVHAVANTDNTVSFKRIETLDLRIRSQFQTEKEFWLAKLANPAPEAK